MPARDIYHANVKNALIKDGWTITLVRVIGFDPDTEEIVAWIP
jgi:hypothetical protein